MPRAPVGDRNRLKKVATDLSRALRARIAGRPLNFKHRFELEKTDTEGWYVVIATMGPQLPGLELWFDRFTGSHERRFWFGFNAPRSTPITEVIKSCPLAVGPRRIVDVDVDEVNGVHSLRTPLSKADAKYPIEESSLKYSEYFFGIYDLEQRPGATDLNLQRAVDFFVSVIRSLPEFRDASEFDRDLEGLATERRRKEYIRATRLVRQLIMQRTAEGTLLCDKCGFNPSNLVAGLPIEPRSLLDVHHVNPMALGGPRWTELCDLALLCPTCHRFAHAELRVMQARAVT
jgi:hypothetical protein